MQKNPNPQGKGLVPVLAALASATPRLQVPPKHIEQVSSELFTALFILESEFRFKPVCGRRYWLYRYGERFQLSLLAPQQWCVATFDQVIACCELHSDLSWTLELSAEAAADQAFMQQVASKRQAFDEQLQTVEQIDDILPTYHQQLPFYQRVFASGLASSLSRSMQLAGIQGLSYQEAQGLLTQAVAKPVD